mmetsp:Transcript_513/g.1624  ORF Transcript_513/g.1624 Transcript_513/m.1624 type:complete len:260 (-) Transcript_513:734-1513(-)
MRLRSVSTAPVISAGELGFGAESCSSSFGCDPCRASVPVEQTPAACPPCCSAASALLSLLKMPFCRPRCTMRCCLVRCRSSSTWYLSFFFRQSCMSLSRSGLPTAISSILSRQTLASVKLPRPSRAQAFRNQALWSSLFISSTRSAASIASPQSSSLIAACARFLSTALCSSRIIAFSLALLLGARNFLSVSSPCRQLAIASSQLPRCHSTRPSFLHFCPKSRAIFRPCMSMRIRPRSFSFLFCSSSMASFALLTMASI